MLVVRPVHDRLLAAELHAIAHNSNMEGPLSTAQTNDHPDLQCKEMHTVISSLTVWRSVEK